MDKNKLREEWNKFYEGKYYDEMENPKKTIFNWFISHLPQTEKAPFGNPEKGYGGVVPCHTEKKVPELEYDIIGMNEIGTTKKLNVEKTLRGIIDFLTK